ncbi:MAG: hypothetical protein KAQ88_10755 [Hyphomicrobiaceae bacterium]|nr:hypothetical protein [Hyphomicrobiaceae bacterium]
MNFVELTRHDSEPVWVNMELVHLMVRRDDATVLRFVIGVGGGGGIETETVQETPLDILRKH